MHTASTPQVLLQLGRTLPAELAAEIEKQSVYIDRDLLRLEVTPDRSGVRLAVREERADQVVDTVRRFLDAIQGGFRATESKVLGVTHRTSRRAYEPNVFAQLVERGWILHLGRGQVGLAGLALALARALDRQIESLGVTGFGAAPRQYPTLIPSDVLARCGYTSSFPQHLSVVAHLDENFDSIEAFRRANVDQADLRIPDRAAFGHPRACLCPALCYHCYPTLAGTTLPAAGHVETASGRIGRYESSSMVGLDRLWEFTQRSIIWLGADSSCNERRVQAIDAALRMARDWDIDCCVETANDPFFTSVSTAKSFWQRGQDLKFELRAYLDPPSQPDARTLAAASFNLHATFFGQAFDIAEHSGGPAFSGCASWGIERLLLVIFTQHGLEVEEWPAPLRALLHAQAG